MPLSVPCAGGVPIPNVNEAAEAPVPASVIGVAAASAIVSVWAAAAGVTVSVCAPDAAVSGTAPPVAVAVNEKGPDCVGVPVSWPPEDSVTPVGRAPAVTVQPYGAMPPAAASDAEYAWLTTAPGRLAAVATSGSNTRM